MDAHSPSSPSYTLVAKMELVSSLLATKGRNELLDLVELVRARTPGTWENFLNLYDPQFRQLVTSPSGRAKPFLLAFFSTLQNEEDLQLLAKFLRPTRCLVHDFSLPIDDDDDGSRKSLVYKTLTHKDYHFDFLPPNNPENWVSTGIAMAVNSLRKAPLSDKMLAVCCQTSLREDQSEAVVRVVVLDDDLKVVLKKSVKPTAVSLSEIQRDLQQLFSEDTIMVGHRLSKDLKALKMDHARVIDTSLAFDYNIGNIQVPPARLPRPSLNFLYKSIVGKELQQSGDIYVQKATAVMSVVRAVETKASADSITLTEEVLLDLNREERRETNVNSKKRKKRKEQKKSASVKKQRR